MLVLVLLLFLSALLHQSLLAPRDLPLAAIVLDASARNRREADRPSPGSWPAIFTASVEPGKRSLLSVAQVAKRLGCSPNKIYRMVRNDSMRVTNVDGLTKICPIWLEQRIEEGGFHRGDASVPLEAERTAEAPPADARARKKVRVRRSGRE